MKKGLLLTIALLVVAAVVAVVGFTQKGDVQKKLDDAVKLVDTTKTEAEAALKAKADELTAAATAAKAEFEGKLAESETAKADLQTKVAELTTVAAAKSEFEAKLAQAEIDKTALQAKVDELTAVIEASKTESGVALQAKVDELTAAAVAAKAEVEAKLAEAETARAALQTKVDELTAAANTTKAETEAALQTKVDEMTAAANTAKAEAEAALKAKADELTAAADAAKAGYEAKLAQAETAKTTLQAKVDELTKAAEAAKAVPAPVVKGGQGMVTSIGSVADATVDKPGSAQVNTIVCSLLLDGQGKILKVTWDEQQTKIQFGMDGKPFELPAPEKLLTKLEKGDAYGMKKASAIGKEWYEQIAAFAEYCKGKTVDEVLAIKTVAVDASHPAVPNVEDLKTSVTVSVSDYLAALQKAAANAK